MAPPTLIRSTRWWPTRRSPHYRSRRSPRLECPVRARSRSLDELAPRRQRSTPQLAQGVWASAEGAHGRTHARTRNEDDRARLVRAARSARRHGGPRSAMSKNARSATSTTTRPTCGWRDGGAPCVTVLARVGPSRSLGRPRASSWIARRSSSVVVRANRRPRRRASQPREQGK